MASNNDIEKRLWSAADQLWANASLRPSELSALVLGLISLRYADHKFTQAEAGLFYLLDHRSYPDGMKPAQATPLESTAEGQIGDRWRFHGARDWALSYATDS